MCVDMLLSFSFRTNVPELVGFGLFPQNNLLNADFFSGFSTAFLEIH